MIITQILSVATNVVAFNVSDPIYDGDGLGSAIDSSNPTTTNESLFTLILRFIDAILSFVGLIALIAIIIAGIYLIVGGVSEDNRKKARDIILYTIIGLIIIIFAKVLITFVVTVF